MDYPYSKSSNQTLKNKKMRKEYIMPSLEMFEVVSEKGFVQSGFDAGIIVPGGGNNGGEDDWV